MSTNQELAAKTPGDLERAPTLVNGVESTHYHFEPLAATAAIFSSLKALRVYICGL